MWDVAKPPTANASCGRVWLRERKADSPLFLLQSHPRKIGDLRFLSFVDFSFQIYYRERSGDVKCMEEMKEVENGSYRKGKEGRRYNKKA